MLFFFFTVRKSGAGERDAGKGLFRNTVCGSARCRWLPLQGLPISLFVCKVCVVLVNKLREREREEGEQGRQERSIKRQVSILLTIYYREPLALE